MKKGVKITYFIVGLLIFLVEKLLLCIGTGYMLTTDNFVMISIIGEIVMHTIDEIYEISQLGFIMSFDYYVSTFFLELLIILYSLAFIIGFFYNLAAFIIGTILGGVMIFVHDRIPEFITYLVLGIHNATHTGVYLLLLPIFVLSIVGIPLLILPAINFTLVFLSVKGLLTNQQKRNVIRV